MKVESGSDQNVGTREVQEDAFGFLRSPDSAFISHAGVAAILCDGMGGLSFGDEAAKTATKTFSNSYLKKTPIETVQEAMRRSLVDANDSVYRLAVSRNQTNKIGCTAIAVVIRGNELFCIHAGDSRVYHYSNKKLAQVTADHHYGQILDGWAAKNELSHEEAANHPGRDKLTSYLGRIQVPFISELDVPIRLTPGDYVLLCSDGLHGVLSDLEIEKCLYDAPNAAAARLIKTTLNLNYSEQDNVSALVLKVGSAQEETAGGFSRANYNDSEKIEYKPAVKHAGNLIEGRSTMANYAPISNNRIVTKSRLNSFALLAVAGAIIFATIVFGFKDTAMPQPVVVQPTIEGVKPAAENLPVPASPVNTTNAPVPVFSKPPVVNDPPIILSPQPAAPAVAEPPKDRRQVEPVAKPTPPKGKPGSPNQTLDSLILPVVPSNPATPTAVSPKTVVDPVPQDKTGWGGADKQPPNSEKSLTGEKASTGDKPAAIPLPSRPQEADPDVPKSK
jgi:PPM family protein phosphatase